MKGRAQLWESGLKGLSCLRRRRGEIHPERTLTQRQPNRKRAEIVRCQAQRELLCLADPGEFCQANQYRRHLLVEVEDRRRGVCRRCNAWRVGIPDACIRRDAVRGDRLRTTSRRGRNPLSGRTANLFAFGSRRPAGPRKGRRHGHRRNRWIDRCVARNIRRCCRGCIAPKDRTRGPNLPDLACRACNDGDHRRHTRLCRRDHRATPHIGECRRIDNRHRGRSGLGDDLARTRHCRTGPGDLSGGRRGLISRRCRSKRRRKGGEHACTIQSNPGRGVHGGGCRRGANFKGGPNLAQGDKQPGKRRLIGRRAGEGRKIRHAAVERADHEHAQVKRACVSGQCHRRLAQKGPDAIWQRLGDIGNDRRDRFGVARSDRRFDSRRRVVNRLDGGVRRDDRRTTIPVAKPRPAAPFLLPTGLRRRGRLIGLAHGT